MVRKSVYEEHPPYKILPPQEKVAKKLGVIIKPSTNKMKKIDVFKLMKFKSNNHDGGYEQEQEIAQIGGYYQDGVPYGDYWTYKKNPKDRYGDKVNPEDKRRRYLVRHEHENKEKLFEVPPTIQDGINETTGMKQDAKVYRFKTGTPSYYADKILW